MNPTFKSFQALAAYTNKQDVSAAKRLQKSRPLSNKKPGTGPRVAKGN